MVLLRGAIVWVVIMLAETLHGVLRALFLAPFVGDFRARQIGVFTGSAIILAVAVAFIGWIRAETRSQLVALGLLWLGMTVGFELSLGRLLGYSWDRIAADYDILEGGLLPLGLLVLSLSPLIAAELRGGTRRDAGGGESPPAEG